MRSQLRPESRQEAPSTPRSRSSSTNSNLASPPPSARAFGILAIPFSATPAPAYVAPSSAAESVQNAVSERPLSEDIGSVIFADAALAQINFFLDTLLYNILSNARSSTLTRIKPAVDTVIKGALGQRAIANGERELEDLLGDGEDDDEMDMEEKEQDNDSAWDLDYVFRRTRLRLMVYMSLATMDDDDEERHVQESQLQFPRGEDREQLSQLTGLVSWKALMFLTAVLEYLAEACLKDAGQFAFARASVARPNEDTSTASVTTSTDDQLVVTDADVRKLNLSPSLGRLWRSWKKVTATPGSSPRLSQQAWQSALSLRRTSMIAVTGDESLLQRRPVDHVGSIEDHLGSVDLPRRPNSDQTSSRRPSPLHAPKRSRSFVRFPVAVASSGPRSWQGSWQSRTSGEVVPEARPRHVRSSSLPPPRLSVFTMPARAKDEAPASAVDVAANREAVIVGPSTSTSDNTTEVAAQSNQPIEIIAKDATSAETITINPVAQVSVPRVVTPVETVQEEEVPSIDEERIQKEPSQDLTADAVLEKPAAPSHTHSHSTKSIEEPALPVVKEEVTLPPPEAEGLPSNSNADDEEYDPFRVDATASGSKMPQSPVQSGSAASGSPAKPLPAKRTQKYTFVDSDDEADSKKDASAATAVATTAGAAAVATTAGVAVADLRKKDKPTPIQTTLNGKQGASSTRADPASEVQGNARQTESDLKPEILSPLKMSPVHSSDYQTPAGPATATSSTTADEKQDVFVTPPRSPVPKVSTEKSSPTLGPSTTPQPKFSTTKDLTTRSEGSSGTKANRKHGQKQTTNERTSAESPSAHSEKEFNDLINGKNTVKRTLTPKDLTEIEVGRKRTKRTVRFELTSHEKPDSSARRQEVVKSVVVPTDDFVFDENAPPIPTSSMVMNGGLPAEATIVRNARNPAPVSPNEPYIPRSPASQTQELRSRPSKSGLTARESRVPQPGSTAELAEFFRSTAPDKPPQNPKPFVASSQAVPEPTKSQVSQISSNANGTGYIKPAANPKRLSSFRGGRNERQGNDDLIAFLNEGPPGARVNKTQSVETTGSSINAGISPARRSASPISHAPSFNESINSRSNLLGTTRRGGSNPTLATESPRSPAVSQQNRPTTNVPKQMGGAPVRKQRRVKDPYAIDIDDEDEGDDILMGLPNKREEGMSMIDFLRSTEPPPREEPNARTKSASNPALASKDVAAARAAATASPSIPDFLKDPGRGPSRRSSRDSFGSAFRGEKTRRGSTKSGEGKTSRFSFFRSSKVAG